MIGLIMQFIDLFVVF